MYYLHCDYTPLHGMFSDALRHQDDFIARLNELARRRDNIVGVALAQKAHRRFVTGLIGTGLGAHEPPEGWVLAKDGTLRPARGKKGTAAKRWLTMANNAMPPHPVIALNKRAGLPDWIKIAEDTYALPEVLSTYGSVRMAYAEQVNMGRTLIPGWRSTNEDSWRHANDVADDADDRLATRRGEFPHNRIRLPPVLLRAADLPIT